MDPDNREQRELPVIIDPYGWLLTLPMALGLYWLYLQPEAHPIREFWRNSLEREKAGWGRLGFEPGSAALAEPRAAATLFWSIMAALSAVTTLSFAAYLGLL